MLLRHNRVVVPTRIFALFLALYCLSATLWAQGPPPPTSFDCAADGVVVNSVTGQPIIRAQVLASSSGTQRVVLSNSTGQWRFDGLPCGPTTLTALRTGFLQGQTPGLSRVNLMKLVSGSPIHDFKISLTPQVVVNGRVLDPEGDPVLNARIVVLTSRIVNGKRTFQQSGNTNTNDLGEYRVPTLSSGKYVVCAFPAAFGGMFLPGTAGDAATGGEACYPGFPEPGMLGMDLPAGREARVDFNLPRVSVVQVRGTLSGVPKGRSVSLSLIRQGMPSGMGASPRQALLMPDGTFAVMGVTPGSYLATCDYFEGSSRLSARMPVQVGGSDVDGVNLQLEPALSIPGRVRMEVKSGAPTPVPTFAMSLESSDAVGGVRVVWGKDGAFTIETVTPGTYRLNAFPPGKFFVKSATLGGRDFLSQDVAIAGPPGPLEVLLSDDGGALDIQVEDADGKPVESWVLTQMEGRPARFVHVNSDGRIAAQGLAPGKYRVSAWDDNQLVEYANPDWMRRYPAGQSVTVEAGQSASVKVVQNRVGGQ